MPAASGSPSPCLPRARSPSFPSMPLSRFDFRCEAYKDCRVGSVSWNDFNGITLHSSGAVFKNLHQNDLQQWYRLLLRSSGFLNLGLHERIVITLLELSSDFGNQRVARHAFASIVQSPEHRRSRWRFAAASHRALGSVGARTPGYSSRKAINRMRGRDRKYDRRPPWREARSVGHPSNRPRKNGDLR